MVSRDQFKVLIAVYMMASRHHGTIYVGVTSELPDRVFKHREGLMPGFTKDYHVHRLVWFERHESMAFAIHREKQLKKYKREWKINLIERENPYWIDLFSSLIGATGPSATEVMGRRDLPGDDG
jgi:putative endonuclease